MKKLQNLMPVSVFVKAFCKVMKTLVEDEVVVNDIMLQLSTEMAFYVQLIICICPTLINTMAFILLKLFSTRLNFER